MDKRVIFAVAGSGKTTLIINQLDLKRRVLIVTYTNTNYSHLLDEITKKFGNFPPNIRLYTYFSFLYSFCYKPIFFLKHKPKGISYKINPNFYIKQTEKSFYFDEENRLYSNRISRLLIYKNSIKEIIERIEKYFDALYIDEVQDIAGNDFSLLEELSKANVEFLLVGDFFQHTFDTSRDGNVNSKLFDDYEKYKARFEKMGMAIDENTLVNSYRCTPSVCEFIRTRLGISIFSNREESSVVKSVLDQDQINVIMLDNEIVKLFFKEHYKHNCYSKNWGECKGEDNYVNVCVVLNKTTYEQFNKKSIQLQPSTKNKLYVACTRARKDLVFIPEVLLSKSENESN
jgi:DNA helicase II / ATP-dependent DNA helicase PcrA